MNLIQTAPDRLDAGLCVAFPTEEAADLVDQADYLVQGGRRGWHLLLGNGRHGFLIARFHTLCLRHVGKPSWRMQGHLKAICQQREDDGWHAEQFDGGHYFLKPRARLLADTILAKL